MSACGGKHTCTSFKHKTPGTHDETPGNTYIMADKFAQIWKNN
jgi:hypothetical protein